MHTKTASVGFEKFGNFRKLLQDAASFTPKAASDMPDKAPSRRTKMTTTIQNTFQSLPKTVKFAGDRGGGLLKASKPTGVEKEKRKRRGGKGGAKKNKKDDRKDGRGPGRGAEAGQGIATLPTT